MCIIGLNPGLPKDETVDEIEFAYLELPTNVGKAPPGGSWTTMEGDIADLPISPKFRNEDAGFTQKSDRSTADLAGVDGLAVFRCSYAGRPQATKS